MTGDVRLEPLTADAAERMFRWVSDPAVRRNVGIREEPTLSRTRQWLANAASDATIRAYAIMVADAHAGNVVLDRIDHAAGTARLSIYIGEPDLRQRGIGTEAVRAAGRIAFAELSLQKIWLTVATDNLAAVQAYSRAGFRIEGTLRREFWTAGGLLDCHYMGLLREEFIDR
jgi:[ribosomal protein S5]-alanine N-acetyltransferase